jgi:hypothetical protein
MLSYLKLYHDTIVSAYPIIKETVPQTERGYKTNNKYNNVPSIMNDGRSITTSTQLSAIINTDLIKRNNITSNWQYRQYLTTNASDIMKYNFTESSNDMGYYKRYINDIDTNNSINNPIPSFLQSDLKDTYLTREQLNARKIAPIIKLPDLK